MDIKFTKQLSLRIIKDFKDLSWSNYDMASPNGTFLVFIENKIPKGIVKFVLESLELKNGIPFFDLYIEKFEVNSNYRNEGIGKFMYNWLVGNYNINKIKLHHVIVEYDNGCSKKWWKSLGFKCVNKNAMSKIIHKRQR